MHLEGMPVHELAFANALGEYLAGGIDGLFAGTTSPGKSTSSVCSTKSYSLLIGNSLGL